MTHAIGVAALNMKPDPANAQRIGSRLVIYMNSLAKRLEILDAVNLQVILTDTSHDPLAAEQELVMAWRYYTQELEQQIAWGEYRSCSTPEEIGAASRFMRARAIIFDPADVKGVAHVESQIASTIQQDVLINEIKWQALQAQDKEQLKKLGELWKPNQLPATDSEHDTKMRKEFAESGLQWCKSKNEYRFRKYYGHRINAVIREMLEEHRDYWAQRPTEPYDDSALQHIFAFSIYGGNYGMGSVFCAWDLYIEHRIFAHKHHVGPFGHCTDDVRALNIQERRKLPIEWPHSHPNAREIIESHIRTIIREDIVADISKWERHRRGIEEEEKRYEEVHLRRIQNHRDALIAYSINPPLPAGLLRAPMVPDAIPIELRIIKELAVRIFGSPRPPISASRSSHCNHCATYQVGSPLISRYVHFYNNDHLQVVYRIGFTETYTNIPNGLVSPLVSGNHNSQLLYDTILARFSPIPEPIYFRAQNYSTPLTLPFPYISAIIDRIPSGSHAYIEELLSMKHIAVRVVPDRRSKCGDHTRLATGEHLITINDTDDRVSFLLTLLHEIAHALAPLAEHSKPHDRYWKLMYANLLIDSLDFFPKESAAHITSLACNPRYSS